MAAKRSLSPAKTLSPREREIVELVAAGKTNKEIAALLVISLNTVKAHLGNIMGKLGVRNRVELATYALGRSGESGEGEA